LRRKNDCIFATLEAVEEKLDELLPLGYPNVGGVIDVGKNSQEFLVGDWVVSNGSHAEVVDVSKKPGCKNRCSKRRVL